MLLKRDRPLQKKAARAVRHHWRNLFDVSVLHISFAP